MRPVGGPKVSQSDLKQASLFESTIPAMRRNAARQKRKEDAAAIYYVSTPESIPSLHEIR
jgi:hypothetical protein